MRDDRPLGHGPMVISLSLSLSHVHMCACARSCAVPLYSSMHCTMTGRKMHHTYVCCLLITASMQIYCDLLCAISNYCCRAFTVDQHLAASGSPRDHHLRVEVVALYVYGLVKLWDKQVSCSLPLQPRAEPREQHGSGRAGQPSRVL